MTTTQKQARHSQFKRGQGVYACRCCDRNTRDTGDNGGVQLCPECYDLAGEENHMSDNGGALYDSPARVLEMIAYVASKGGNVACWNAVKARALELLPAATPAPAIGKPQHTTPIDSGLDLSVYNAAVKFTNTIQSPANRKLFAHMVDQAYKNANLTIGVEQARPLTEWADQFRGDIQLYLDNPSFHGTLGQVKLTVKHPTAYFKKAGVL